MQKTKTIYVNARFVTQPLTGVQRYAFECCMQMKMANPDLIFLSPKNIIRDDWARLLNVQVIGFNTGHLWEQIDLAFYLLHKKDAVVFNPCNTAPLILSINYITVHDVSYALYKENNPWLFGLWYNFLLPRIIKKAKHVFTVSETVRQQLMSMYDTPPEKISITYNGMTDAFENNKSVPFQKEKIILAVGSISKRKNLDMLIDAFRSSSLAGLYTLVIAGAPHQAFKKIELASAESIRFESNLNDDELSLYYHRAEMFVSLSLYEGFGLPVLEAICSGCKVLCSDIPTYHELFGEYVYFCNHLKKDEVIFALEEMSRNKQTKSIDHERLKKKYSFSESAKHILARLENSKGL